MTIDSTMSTLMDDARKYFELDRKLSISNLVSQFNPNPNLFNGAIDFSGNNWVIDPTYNEDGTYRGMKVYKTTNAWNGIYQPYTCKKGKTYTFSFYAREEDNVKNQYATVYILPASSNRYDSMNIVGNTSFLLQPNWKRYALTFTMNYDYTLNLRIESNAMVPSWRCGYKLEEGSIPTPIPELMGGGS